MEAADVIYFRIQINFTNVCHSTQRFQAQKLEYFLSIPINMDEQRGGGGATLPDFFFCSLIPLQQTTSGIGHRVR